MSETVEIMKERSRVLINELELMESPFTLIDKFLMYTSFSSRL